MPRWMPHGSHHTRVFQDRFASLQLIQRRIAKPNFMNTDCRCNVGSSSVRRHLVTGGCGGFTLTELLVVLATAGILSVVLLPALAGNQPGNAKAFQCLNNMRQLGLAWLLYANDNHDRLVSNSDASGTGGGNRLQNWICPATGGTLPVLDWSANANDFNTGLLTIDQYVLGARSTALLGNHVAKSTTIYLCPADNYLSAAQRASALPAQHGLSSRIRSCAMNGAMGDGSKFFAGAWPQFYNAKKLTDMHSPGPSECWVVADEHPDANDDCVLYVNPADAHSTTSDNKSTELPGSLHDKAAGMFFADCHSELHRWTGSLDTPPIKFITYAGQNVSVTGDTAAVKDLTWFANHSPQN